MNASKGDILFRQSEAISTSIEGTPNARGEGAVVSGETIEALVQKVGAPSIAEIEKLIGDLQAARSYLESESERIPTGNDPVCASKRHGVGVRENRHGKSGAMAEGQQRCTQRRAAR